MNSNVKKKPVSFDRQSLADAITAVTKLAITLNQLLRSTAMENEESGEYPVGSFATQSPLKESKYPIPKTNEYKVSPKAAYRTGYEYMRVVLESICAKEKRAVTKSEWWAEIQKGSTRGGRAPRLSLYTFNQYAGDYSTGKNYQNLKLWERPRHGYYHPIENE